MRPLRVIARLQNSFNAVDPWSPAIDGILAYQVIRGMLGDDFSTQSPTDLTIDADLPLERIEHDGRWWWACSSPQYDVITKYARYEHRRFDFQHAIDHLHDGTKNILVVGGPYKNARNRNMMTVTDSVQWHVIGDADGIRDLVAGCTSIGARRGSGCGVVLDWMVTEEGADEHAARFRRPLPFAYAESHGVTGAPMEWGYIPRPHWDMERTLCVMPV
jgi:CRISPR type IV-associated protein Csf3